MNQKERKVNHFLYTSSLLSIVTAGYNLVQKDCIDALAYINLAGGLYAIADSLKVDKKTYVKNLNFYEKATKFAAFSCILIPDIPYEKVPIVIYLFIGGNMYLFSEIFNYEKKKI